MAPQYDSNSSLELKTIALMYLLFVLFFAFQLFQRVAIKQQVVCFTVVKRLLKYCYRIVLVMLKMSSHNLTL